MKSFMALSSVALAATASNASIVLTTGAAIEIEPPASVQQNAMSSDTDAFVFRERASITLDAALEIDQVASGLTDQLADLVGGQVDAGVVFDSFYLYADSASGGQDFIGSVTFDQPIIGVFLRNPGLNATDPILGAPGTSYPTGGSTRDLEFGGQDQFTISDDRLTISFDFRTSSGVDSIRVLTEVPGPASAFGVIIALGVAARRRR